jgi:hypothetical protein
MGWDYHLFGLDIKWKLNCYSLIYFIRGREKGRREQDSEWEEIGRERKGRGKDRMRMRGRERPSEQLREDEHQQSLGTQLCSGSWFWISPYSPHRAPLYTRLIISTKQGGRRCYGKGKERDDWNMGLLPVETTKILSWVSFAPFIPSNKLYDGLFLENRLENAHLSKRGRWGRGREERKELIGFKN